MLLEKKYENQAYWRRYEIADDLSSIDVAPFGLTHLTVYTGKRSDIATRLTLDAVESRKLYEQLRSRYEEDAESQDRSENSNYGARLAAPCHGCGAYTPIESLFAHDDGDARLFCEKCYGAPLD